MHPNFLAVALILIGVFSRLIPHAPNATAITAITVAAVLYLKRPHIVALPLLALLLSDLVIGLYDWRVMSVVYGSFGAIALASTYAPRLKYGWVLTLIGSPVFFFLTTNFMVWLTASWYEKSLSGLLLSYELGLPFLRSMMLGDLLYAGVILGAFECARHAARNGMLTLLPQYAFRDIIARLWPNTPCASTSTWPTRSSARAAKQMN